MDKYEFNTRIDQIKRAMVKKDFKTATQAADLIDWARVKNNSILLLVADAYEADKQYDKAKEVLLIAYKRAPMGRQLAYRLSILSVKMKDFADAEEFYLDFKQIAPADTAAYILKYRIAKGRGESTEALIQILEAYNEVDMEEKWAYELAKLYHQIGNIDKCVAQCDEISLWFNEGIYVTKALKLKQKYTPLTKGQQERLDISATKTFEPIKDDFENEDDSSDDIKIKEFSGNGDDTIDIQETIAKSMEILLQNENNSQTEDSSQIEDDSQTEESKVDTPDSETDSENTAPEKKLGDTNSILNPMYKVEGDGQIILDVDEEEQKIEKQITGQLGIEEVLKDLENRGILKPHTVAATVNAMDKATSVVEEAKEETEAYLSRSRTSSLIDTIEKISESEDIEKVVGEAEETDNQQDDIVVELDAEEDIENAAEQEDENEAEQEAEQETENVQTADDDIEETVPLNTAEFENLAEALEQMAEQTEAIELQGESTRHAEDIQESDEKSEPEEKSDAIKIKIKKDSEPEEEKDNNIDEQKTGANKNSGKIKLSQEYEERFASFMVITGLEEHLAITIDSLTAESGLDGTSSKNNIIIMGDEKSGKTTLAIELIKVINEQRGRNARKIAKISASALNKRGFANSFNKLLKCDLIIEDASKLDADTIEEIVTAGQYYTDDMVIILEDSSSDMKKFIDENPTLQEMFGNKLILKEFNLQEWVAYAEEYAETQGYMIDSVGQLALAHTIDEVYGIRQGMEEEDIKEIVDKAIEKASRKISKKFTRIFSGGKDEMELDVLREKDFM